MTSSFRTRLFVVVCALMFADAVSAQSFAWWRMDSVRSELGLSAQQSTAIDDIFQKAIAELREQKDDLDHEEGRLSGLIAGMAEESQVVRQIDRVETLRSSMNKTRTLMLLHMRQVLTADQRAKLNVIHERWEQEQRTRERQRSSQGGDGRPDGQRRRAN